MCDICGADMGHAESCIKSTIEVAGRDFQRVRYGAEAEDWGAGSGARLRGLPPVLRRFVGTRRHVADVLWP
jgi:hypothetical protein